MHYNIICCYTFLTVNCVNFMSVHFYLQFLYIFDYNKHDKYNFETLEPRKINTSRSTFGSHTRRDGGFGTKKITGNHGYTRRGVVVTDRFACRTDRLLDGPTCARKRTRSGGKRTRFSRDTYLARTLFIIICTAHTRSSGVHAREY